MTNGNYYTKFVINIILKELYSHFQRHVEFISNKKKKKL